MKKSSFLSMVFSALLAATLVVSCDTGGGGGGGGGGSSAPSSTDIKIIIGSDSSSSDILGDFGAEASDNFYYKVYFTASGTEYSDKGGKGDTITFPNVPFGTYEFNLDIYSDRTEEAILIGTETVTKDIQQAQNTVEFNLKYSAYQNIYFVSDAASFVSALMGLNKDDVPIDKSKMKPDDESTWVRVYVNEDFTIPEDLVTGSLSSETSHYVKVFLNENTITSDSNIVMGDNLNIVFENGKILIPEIQILSSSSSLTLDNVELTQEMDDDSNPNGGIFMEFSSGNVSIKNGCKIVAKTSQPNLSVSEGCTVTVQDSTIEHPNGEAIFMNGGKVTLSGTTVKNGEGFERPCVSVLDGTLSVTNGSKIISKGFDHAMFLSNGIFSVTNESQIIVEGYGNAIEFTGGTLTVSDSIIEAKDRYALHLEKIDEFPAPKAIVTNSALTSGGDVISIYGAELNLKDTTVTTTGEGNYSGIRVSGSADLHAFVKMDGGVVNVPNSSEGYAVVVRTSDFTYDYDICKFVLTGDGKITGKENGLEMDCGTFVMLGGTIETARSGAAAVELSNCVFAMTDSYDGKTATGANSVDKIECCFSEEKSICILMGGNSHADVVNVNSCGVIFAQVSDISGVEKFVGYVQNPVLEGDVTFVAKKDFTIADMGIDFNLPAEFSYTTDASPYSYFDLDEDTTGYNWVPSTLVFTDEPLSFWKPWQFDRLIYRLIARDLSKRATKSWFGLGRAACK